MKRTTRLLALLSVIALLVCGCGHTGEPDRAPDEWRQQIVRLTDSVKTASPCVPLLIDSLLAQAPDSVGYYEAYMWKAQVLLNRLQTDEALRVARRTQQFARRQTATTRVTTLLAQAMALEASVYHRIRQKSKESIRLYSEGLDCIMRGGEKTLAPNFAANLADAYLMVNDIPKAAHYYRRALFLVDSLSLPDEANITLYLGLAQIYTSLEDFPTALYYYRQTEQQYDRMETNMKNYFLNNFGNCYYYKGDYPEALTLFKRLWAHLQTHGDDIFSKGCCMINMADIYLNLQQTDSATLCVNRGDSLLAPFHSDEVNAYINTIRIGIAMRQKDYARVKSLLADKEAARGTELSLLNIRNRYLTDYYVAIGDYHHAYTLSQANKQRNDSALHRKANMRASEIMSRFSEDTLRLHYDLEMGERNAEIAESKAMFYLTLFVLAVIVLGAIVVWNVYRKRKAQTELDMFKLRLITVRQRISPHFVFNVINAKLGNVPREEGDMLVSMAKLIRKNLELTGKTFVPLAEELAFVDRYVSLQSALMGGIDYVRRFLPEEEMEQIVIPSMFVQILVENAIKHGLRNAKGERRLTIEVTGSGEACTVTVTDTGPGFDLRRRSKDSTRSGLSIIRSTMAVVNKNNRRDAQLAFSIGNVTDTEGRITGCQARLTVPKAMRTI